MSKPTEDPGVRSKMEPVELKTQTETVLATIPPGRRPEIATPNPLGERVEAERVRLNGGNLHLIARNLAIAEAPDAALPPAVIKARRKVQEAEAKQAEAQGKLSAELAAWDRYKSLLAQIDEKKKEILNGDGKLQSCRNDIGSFPADFAKWHGIEHQHGWRAVVDRTISTLFAEKAIPHLEAWLKTAREELAKLETAAGELRDKYDFA